MVYVEDIKRIFGEKAEKIGACEVALFGTSALVVSGHKGISAVSPTEIVVRLKQGLVRVIGDALRLVKASPSELYVSGKIRAVEYPEINEVGY